MLALRIGLAGVMTLAAAGCHSNSRVAVATGASAVSRVITASVAPIRETAAVASAEDAADDPAIWRNRADPSKSLIVATDKNRGLNVYGLDGRLRHSLDAGRVNNVDLRDNVIVAGQRTVLVAASDRTVLGDGRLALFELDTKRGVLRPLLRAPVPVNEPYGVCLYRDRSALFAFVIGKAGEVVQLRIDVAGSVPAATVVRTLKLPTQSEGCVADDRSGQLYVAEEDFGIWRVAAAPTGQAAPIKVIQVDRQRLFDDVEGLAIAARGRTGGWLIASSQGDNAYAAWRLPDLRYVGRFRIAAAGGIDGTSDTDGIEISTGDFGAPFTGGLMIAQDGNNAPEAQNFKLVPWASVAKALNTPK